jgi:hypothetical protein
VEPQDVFKVLPASEGSDGIKPRATVGNPGKDRGKRPQALEEGDGGL